MVQEFCLSDTLWERLSPHLPAHTPKVHPLGSHRRRVPDRQVLDGSFFVLRTGCKWQARSATGICSSRTAHSRFQAWVQAGVFARLWDEALHDYEDLIRPDFDSMALDGPRRLAAQSAAGRGKKRVPTPKTAAKAASNAAC